MPGLCLIHAWWPSLLSGYFENFLCLLKWELIKKQFMSRFTTSRSSSKIPVDCFQFSFNILVLTDTRNRLHLPLEISTFFIHKAKHFEKLFESSKGASHSNFFGPCKIFPKAEAEGKKQQKKSHNLWHHFLTQFFLLFGIVRDLLKSPNP